MSIPPSYAIGLKKKTDCRKLDKRQEGSAILLLMLLVSVAFIAALVAILPNQSALSVAASSEISLQEAKEALLSYAATYRDNPDHANEVFGYLPCPDRNGNGIEDGNCGATDTPALGLIPFTALGLQNFRDTEGNCLWYAVSGRFKANPKTGTLNWDTRGQFKIVGPDGTTIILDPATDVEGGVAAVIFSAGPPLVNQTTRNTQSSVLCGNASSAWQQFLESIPNNAFDSSGHAADNNTITITLGGAGNDRAVWITPKEIFDRIVHRSDSASLNFLGTQIRAGFEERMQTDALTSTATASSALPESAGSCGLAKCGRPPTTLNTSTTFTSYFNQWRTQYGAAICSSLDSACLTINDNPCRGGLFLGGRHTTGGPRSSTTTFPDDFFEASGALGIFQGISTSFSGNSLFSGLSASLASADTGLCLFQGSKPLVSFEKDIAGFTTVNVGALPTAQVDTGAKTVTLGDTDAGAAGAVGCVWYGQALDFTTVARVYFRFQIIDKGQGFTFAMADAGSNSPGNSSPVMCGGAGSLLGYAGAPAGATTQGIAPPKLAIEFDTATNSTRVDPTPSGTDHLAVVYWGDNTDSIAPLCTAGQCTGADDNTHRKGVGTAQSPLNPRTLTTLSSGIASATWFQNLAIITTSTVHGLHSGQSVNISGVVPAAYNGSPVITVLDTATFAYSLPVNPGNGSGGTVTNADVPGIANVTSSNPLFSSGTTSLPLSPAGQSVPYNGTSSANGVIHVRVDLSKARGSQPGQSVLNLTAYIGDVIPAQDYSSTCNVSDLMNLSRDLTEICSQTAMITQKAVPIMDRRSVIGASWSNNQVVLTTATPHGVNGTTTLRLKGFTPTAYNGDFDVSRIDDYHLSFALATDPGTLKIPGALTNPVQTATWDATTSLITLTTAAPHGLVSGGQAWMQIESATPSSYNDFRLMTAVDDRTLTFRSNVNPGTYQGSGDLVISPRALDRIYVGFTQGQNNSTSATSLQSIVISNFLIRSY